jgi:hypothetical protein
VLGLVAKDVLSDAQAEKQLRELKEREAGRRAEVDTLAATLADVPDAEPVRLFVERIEDALGSAVVVYDDNGEPHPATNPGGAAGQTSPKCSTA